MRRPNIFMCVVRSMFKALYLFIGGEEMFPTGINLSCQTLDGYCVVESWLQLTCLYIGQIFMAALIGNFKLRLLQFCSNAPLQLLEQPCANTPRCPNTLECAGTFAAVLESIDLAGKVFNDKVEALNEYMRAMKLPPELKYAIRDYYQVWFLERGTSVPLR